MDVKQVLNSLLISGYFITAMIILTLGGLCNLILVSFP